MDTPQTATDRRTQTDAMALAVRLARAADEKKAESIVVIDLRGRSQVTDFFVIATASNPRLRRAVTEAIRYAADDIGAHVFGAEGEGDACWALLDFVDVIVHIFDSEWRELYDLELLWGDAPHVPWQEQTDA